VIKFAKLNLRNCLEDAAASIGNERTKLRLQDTGMDIIEGLASLVEFDGLGELLRRAVRSGDRPGSSYGPLIEYFSILFL